MKSLKPMLGQSIDESDLVTFLKTRGPLMASFKLDGIRALVKDGVVLSRSLKPIPNPHVQALFGRPEYEGFDGELIVGERNATDVFRVTTSGVMSESGEPNVTYWVFDIWNEPNTPFHQRTVEAIDRIVCLPSDVPIHALHQMKVATLAAIDNLFEAALFRGFEGLILRNPLGLYKFGRSTVKEAGLLKMKPFVDAEATVIGIVEQMHNGNEAFTNELGRTARSTAKAGKTAMGVLGALVCRTPEGQEFEVGTGFTAAEREAFWLDTGIIGRIVKYKSLVIGVKDKPRHAVFLGFRDRRDT